jgi:hypothetical protein
LSGALRDQVKNGNHCHVHQRTAARRRDGLQTLFGSQTSTSLSLSRVSGHSRDCDRSCVRRLVAAGCTIHYCLVYYERGGGAHTWHVALFHWTPAATRFEWGGTAPGGLATIDDVRNAILSGVIKGPARFW